MQGKEKSKDKGLAELIAALSKSEKRYFQLSIPKGAEEGNINAEFFQAYLEHGEEAEAQLRQRHPEAGFHSHFSASKYQVFERIMRTMRDFHQQNSIDARLHSLLDDIAFLHGKGLWGLLRKRLRKATRLASRFERFTIQMELLPWERKFLFQQHPADLLAKLHELDLRCEGLFRLIQAENKAETLHAAIFALGRHKTRLQSPDEIAEMEQLLQAKPEIDAEAPGSTFIRILLSNARGAGAFLLGRYESAFDHFQVALENMQARPEMLPRHIEHYRIALTNFSNCCFYLDRMPQFQKAMEAMQQLRNLPRQDQLQFEATRYHLELMQVLNHARFEHGLALLPELQAWIKAHETELPQARLITLRYNAALLQFMVGGHKQSLRWLHPILNSPSQGRRADIYEFAHFLELFNHFELGNMRIIDSRIRSLERKKTGAFKGKPFLLSLLSFFQKWEKGFLDPALHRLAEDLEKAGEKGARPPSGWQETTFWLQSRQKGIPLDQYIRELVQQRN